MFHWIIHRPSEYVDSHSPAVVVDPAENVKGMYRLLDLISESGSNGYGKGHSLDILGSLS